MWRMLLAPFQYNTFVLVDVLCSFDQNFLKAKHLEIHQMYPYLYILEHRIDLFHMETGEELAEYYFCWEIRCFWHHFTSECILEDWWLNLTSNIVTSSWTTTMTLEASLLCLRIWTQHWMSLCLPPKGQHHEIVWGLRTLMMHWLVGVTPRGRVTGRGWSHKYYF